MNEGPRFLPSYYEVSRSLEGTYGTRSGFEIFWCGEPVSENDPGLRAHGFRDQVLYVMSPYDFPKIEDDDAAPTVIGQIVAEEIRSAGVLYTPKKRSCRRFQLPERKALQHLELSERNLGSLSEILQINARISLLLGLRANLDELIGKIARRLASVDIESLLQQEEVVMVS